MICHLYILPISLILFFIAFKLKSKIFNIANTDLSNLASISPTILFLNILHPLFMFWHICLIFPSSCLCRYLSLESTYLFFAWLTFIAHSHPSLPESFCCLLAPSIPGTSSLYLHTSLFRLGKTFQLLSSQK